VAGFRFDAIGTLFEDANFTDEPVALVGHPVERRANPNIEAMGEGRGRRDQDGGLERLCTDAPCYEMT
jgi:hypothetical protein